MITKLSMKKLLSLPFGGTTSSSSALLPLSYFAKEANKFLTLCDGKYSPHYNDSGDPMFFTNSQLRFQSNPLRKTSTYDNGLLGHYARRSIHYSAHSLKNKDENVNKEVASNISYAIVPKGKPDIISNFLTRNYHQQEPLSVTLGMPLMEVEGWFQRFIQRSMFVSVSDVSVQAVDEKLNRRVGVLCSIIIDPATTRSLLDNSYTDPTRHPVTTQMNELYDSLEDGLNPVEAAGVTTDDNRSLRLLEHMYISVHPDYTNQGISSKMVELSESLAANVINCRVGYTITTSEYSYAIFLKHGYKVVREIKYADYADSKGEKIFAGKEDKLKPHHACRAMVKEIKSLY